MNFQFGVPGSSDKEYLNCIASAGMYTVFAGKDIIDGDELFFGMINFVKSQPYAQVFFEIIGLKKIDQIIKYANELYQPPKPFPQQLTMQLQLTSKLQKQLHDANVNTTDNLIRLFFIAINAVSAQTLERSIKNKIGILKIQKALPQINAWIESLSMSAKQIFQILQQFSNQYGISISELSKMDIIELQELASAIQEEQGVGLQNTQEDDINKQLYLLIDKLMQTVKESAASKSPINKRINPVFASSSIGEEEAMPQDSKNQSSIGTEERGEESTKKLTVEYFGNNLTNDASLKLLDPVIGREREIDQIIYTLLRKTKNSPMLIGEAGVGKTAIVEGLAQRIAEGRVPDRLKNHKVINLDMAGMIAGTKYRGEFEQRLKSVLEEASDPLNQIILFIDEIHTIIGAGGHEGQAGETSNTLKPLLARGKIKLIGATTFDEYQKYIEKDAALKRRFQEINVDEPTPEDTLSILEGLKERFESFHDVNISSSAIEYAVGLSTRYILNKHLPDKAIDLIDEACARKSVLLSKLEHNQEYLDLAEELKEIEKLIEQAVSNQDYFKAAELKQQELEQKSKMKSLKSKSSMPSHLRPTIDSDDIGQVLSDKLGIPTDIIKESEIEKLTGLRAIFDQQIFGQAEAVDKVIKAIQKSRLSIIPKQKPIASFLFLGPSGVGKTYIAKLIAEHYFHDPKSLIRIDMSEYMERYSVSKIIGSAPGYVGYDEGGSLTEQIRRKPYSVLLFDEIEKADKSVLNILLQILDEGQLKDSKGRAIDFKNTVIVMTSNIGSEYFSQQGKQIGFNYNSEREDSESLEFEHTKGLVLDKLNDFMPPELINRIDHKIVFAPLGQKELEHVFKKLYKQFAEQRKANPLAVVPRYTDKMIVEKVKELRNPQYGARPIEKYIANDLEDEVISSLLTHQ
ncbi:MAG: ATP-dependent Clp protease ATP-binding subunit [Candidatus Absconditabacterales bacterium]